MRIIKCSKYLPIANDAGQIDVTFTSEESKFNHVRFSSPVESIASANRKLE